MWVKIVESNGAWAEEVGLYKYKQLMEFRKHLGLLVSYFVFVALFGGGGVQAWTLHSLVAK